MLSLCENLRKKSRIFKFIHVKNIKKQKSSVKGAAHSSFLARLMIHCFF